MPRAAPRDQGLALQLATDPASALSIAAVEQALSWYSATLSHAQGAPFGAQRAQELANALREHRTCDAQLFDQLINFGRLMHRLSGKPGVPPCNVGDVLVATAWMPPAHVDGHWERGRAVDQATFDKLGFAATSAGIANAQQNNRDAWRSHTERCRSFIERAVDLPADRRSAVVLGVGHAFDLPLATLGQTFDHLVLVDVDAKALGATAETVLRTEPRARIDTRTLDLTGVNRTMVSTLDELVRVSKDRETVQRRIEDYVRSYRTEPLQVLEQHDQADLVISSCVASQLAWPQRAYALARLEELGPVVGEAERSWSRAWFELELRVQQDHIRVCTDAGRVTVLISDVVNQLTALDASGLERPTGDKVFTLGVDSLLERIPQAIRAERHASWIWPRHRPGPSGEPGSWMDVEALVLYDRLNTTA